MAAFRYLLLLLIIGGTQARALSEGTDSEPSLFSVAATTNTSTNDDLSNVSYAKSSGRRPKQPKLPECSSHYCHLGECHEETDVGAVCSCPDNRFFLAADGVTCKKKTCTDKRAKRRYECGNGATCNMKKYDSRSGLELAQCVCPQSRLFAQWKYDSSTRSCYRDSHFQTCSWPRKYPCDQLCRVNYKLFSGSKPECYCRDGYRFDTKQNKCVVSDPCKADNSNGGCDQICNFNKQTLQVRCSCHDVDYTLASDGKGCLKRSCQNKNSGCEQQCIPTSPTDFYCGCKAGYKINTDRKTCYDYDECGGQHGCSQLCIPDGKGYYECGCRPGYTLNSNGHACDVEDKCKDKGCSFDCNPDTGECLCDSFHQLAADGVSCEDIDECKLGTDNCQERCVNTDGGFSCECFNEKARLANDLRTCTLDTCAELGDIDYGTTTCNNVGSEMVVGDSCTFSCKSGTRLTGGVRQVTCTPTGYDSSPPYCADIDECRDPLICAENEVCSNTFGSYACVCDNGFQVINGKCTDITGPQIISCPKDVILQLPDDGDSVSYKWEKPVAFDPTDASLSCDNCPASEQRDFKLGSYVINYWFRDAGNNRAQCTFKVKVIDVTPPKFQNCPNGRTFVEKPGVYDISKFAQVTATDNSGDVTLTNDKPPKFSNPGITTVNYLAKDASGNDATCTFYVNIVVKDCPQLPPIEHGSHGCNDWHIGTTCSPKCDENYSFLNPDDSKGYHCGDDGTWVPATALPTCHPVKKPTEARLSYVATYNYDTCPKTLPNAITSIHTMAITTFNTSKSVFCYAGDSCSLVGEPEIECQATTFTVTFNLDESFVAIPAYDQLIVEFRTRIEAKQKKNKNRTFMGLFIPPVDILSPKVDVHGLPITPVFKLECPTQSKRVDDVCVACPAGMAC